MKATCRRRHAPRCKTNFSSLHDINLPDTRNGLFFPDARVASTPVSWRPGMCVFARTKGHEFYFLSPNWRRAARSSENVTYILLPQATRKLVARRLTYASYKPLDSAPGQLMSSKKSRRAGVLRGDVHTLILHLKFLAASTILRFAKRTPRRS